MPAVRASAFGAHCAMPPGKTAMRFFYVRGLAILDVSCNLSTQVTIVIYSRCHPGAEN